MGVSAPARLRTAVLAGDSASGESSELPVLLCV